jgi:hypothetical protein
VPGALSALAVNFAQRHHVLRGCRTAPVPAVPLTSASVQRSDLRPTVQQHPGDIEHVHVGVRSRQQPAGPGWLPHIGQYGVFDPSVGG